MLNGLSHLADDILSWKRKYGDIFYIKIKDNVYIFRTLTKGEYFSILDVQGNISKDINNILLKECILYPKNYCNFNLLLAGEVEYLISKIVELSGFSNGDKLVKDIEKERNNIGKLDNQIVLIICRAFPQLTPKDLNNLNYYTMLNYLALAEEILGVKLKIEKPNDQTKINFDEDNKDLIGSVPVPPINKKPKRGDVSK